MLALPVIRRLGAFYSGKACGATTIDRRILAQLSWLAMVYRIGFAAILCAGVYFFIQGRVGIVIGSGLFLASFIHVITSVLLGNYANPKFQQAYSIVVYAASIALVVVVPELTLGEGHEDFLRLLVIVGAVAIGAGGTLRFSHTILALVSGGVAGFTILQLRGNLPDWSVIHRSYSVGLFLACFAALMRENQNKKLYLGKALLKEEKRSYEELAKEMRALTQVDPLTGLSNRRYLEESLANQWSTALQTQHLISVMFVDIDHFKKYNDCYGHLAGDAVIAQVADSIKSIARRSGDLAARFGGEEFILTSVQRDKECLERHAESLVKAVQQLNIRHEASPFGVVTVSVGVCYTVPNEEDRYENLIHMADLALYEAKAAGRNRVATKWNLVAS